MPHTLNTGENGRFPISLWIDRTSRYAPFILVAGAIITAVLFSWIILFAFKKVETSMKGQMLNRLQLEAKMLADIIEEHLEREAEEIEGLSQILAMAKGNEKTSRKMLENFYARERADKESPMIVALLDRNGREVFSYPETPLDNIFTPYFRSANDRLSGGGGSMILGPDYVNTAGSFMTFIAPLYGKSNRIKGAKHPGSAIVLISLRGIKDNFLEDGVHYLMIDREKVIHAYSEAPDLIGTKAGDPGGPGLKPYPGVMADAILGGSEGQADLTVAGVNILTGFAPINLHSKEGVEEDIQRTGEGEPFLSIAIYKHAEDIVSEIFQTKNVILIITILLAVVVTACILLGYLVLRYQLQEADRSHKVRIDTVHEISGAAAHNLNQPITAIFGYLKMLKIKAERGDNGLAGDVHLFTGKSEEELEKINSIIRKMRNMIDYTTEEYPGDITITSLEDAECKTSEDRSGK